MSTPRLRRRTDKKPWQYHPRSDHHSKVACWSILFDLMLASDLLREHAIQQRIAFGINHKMTDHTNGRSKNLDLVVCRPLIGVEAPKKAATFASLATRFGIDLDANEVKLLSGLPELTRQPVGSVLMALEAKAAMTEFGKARPRLYDELASSHVVIHGDTDSAIAVGFAMINGAETFLSPTKNPCIAWGAPEVLSKHKQPNELRLTVEKIRALPRREAVGKAGFDAISAVAVHCANDGTSPVQLITKSADGAVAASDVLHYDTMINRVVGIYNSRFPRA